MLYSVILNQLLVVMFQVTPGYLQKINKYVKKQENWNRRLRKQMVELTGVSTVPLNDLFYVGL